MWNTFHYKCIKIIIKKRKNKTKPITFQISYDNYKRYSIRDNTAHSLCNNKLNDFENNSKEYWKINIIIELHTSTYHNTHDMLILLNMQLYEPFTIICLRLYACTRIAISYACIFSWKRINTLKLKYNNWQWNDYSNEW